MDWLKLLVGPVIGASVAGIVTLSLAVFGPGRYWGWRLQKLLDLINGMDQIPEFAPQRAALLDEADYVSRKVAAMHRVPTDWSMFVVGILGYGAGYGLLISVPYWIPDMTWPWTIVFWLGIALAMFLGSLNLVWASQSHDATKAERARFISEGMPPDFTFRPSARPYWMPPHISGQATYRPPKRMRPPKERNPASVPRVCQDAHEQADSDGHGLDTETS